MPLNLETILQYALEYEKIRDAATPGEWKVSDHKATHISTSYEIGFGLPALIAESYSRNGDDNSLEAQGNATFIAAAKSYDSPKIIRELVDRVNELEAILYKAYEQVRCEEHCGILENGQIIDKCTCEAGPVNKLLIKTLKLEDKP